MKTHKKFYTGLDSAVRGKALLLIGIAFLFAPCAWAGGTVTNPTEAALRTALTGGGLVTFACDGTITLSSTITNDLDATLDGSGHQVVLSGGNAVQVLRVNSGVHLTLVNLTIANGTGVWGGGICNSNGALTLIGVTVRDNTASNLPYQPPDKLAQGGQGGGIYSEGTLNATNCTFIGNAARQRQTVDTVEDVMSLYTLTPCFGGAIYCGGELNLVGCAFTGNGAYAAPGYYLTRNYDPVWASGGREARGGAIACSSVTYLRSCMFSGNSARAGWSPGAPFSPTTAPYTGQHGSAGYGGAVSAASATIYGCSFLSNSVRGGGGGAGGSANWTPGGTGGQGGASYGGALYGGGIIADTVVAWNTSQAGGGGEGGGSLSYKYYPVQGGPGGSGGAAYGASLYGTFSLVNCTVVSNYTIGGPGGYGGGGAAGGPIGNGGPGGNGYARVLGSGQAATNSTLAQNLAAGGPGGGGNQPGTSGTAVGGLASGSSLLNCILSTNAPANASDWVVDLGHNLSSEADCFTNTTSLRAVTAKLGALAFNGGPTLTMALLPGSSAIDAGDTISGPSTDQRGSPRPVGAAADIGAYEFGSPAYLLAAPGALNTAKLTATGVPNQPLVLQTSTNLTKWSSIATNHFSPGGTWLFDAFGSGQEFFRLELP